MGRIPPKKKKRKLVKKKGKREQVEASSQESTGDSTWGRKREEMIQGKRGRKPYIGRHRLC